MSCTFPAGEGEGVDAGEGEGGAVNISGLAPLFSEVVPCFGVMAHFTRVVILTLVKVVVFNSSFHFFRFSLPINFKIIILKKKIVSHLKSKIK